MNPVLAEIERTSTTRLSSGEVITLQSHVCAGSGRVLRQAVAHTKPRLACEVGLAYGVSALHILDAMQQHGEGRLIGMDPAQHDSCWRGGGLYNIDRAGFTDRYEFHEEPSQRVLPRLAEAGTRIQFGFIDGWHTFDHTLIDFFYIDQMLDPGGIVVLDDVGYPGLRRLAHFVVTNRDYDIVDFDLRPSENSVRRELKRGVQALLRPLWRDDTTPDPRATALERVVDAAQLIALRKRSHDRRRFDHFVPF